MREKTVVENINLTDQLIEQEHEYIAQTYKRAPFVLVHGEGVHLFDSDGNVYTDWVAGIAVNALGYQNEELTDAIQSAAKGLIYVSNLYHTAPQLNWRKCWSKHPSRIACFSPTVAPKPTRAQSNLRAKSLSKRG
jgi:acetylornithine/succinyldiaminopimelate/putrescine aminotransferase